MQPPKIISDRVADERKLKPYLKLSYWTVWDAANIICGYRPPDRAKGETFDMEIFSGDQRAALYFELKSLVVMEVDEGARPDQNARIRPTFALRAAKALGITPPKILNDLLEAEERAMQSDPGDLSPAQETKLYRAIGALLAVIKGQRLGTDAHPDFKSQTNIAEWIASKGEIRGLGFRNLETIFARANREFDDAIG